MAENQRLVAFIRRILHRRILTAFFFSLDKVMWVEWHPTKDGLVAYGTSEGRVGCVETQTSKMPILFKIVHPQPVYRLSWGPFYRRKDEESNKKDLALYSICNSNLFQYDLSKPDQGTVFFFCRFMPLQVLICNCFNFLFRSTF